MTDNVTLNPGTNGAVIGADNIDNVMYQRMKLISGNDGLNEGDISSSNPLPVKFSTVTPVNRSGYILTSNVAQILAPSNPTRKKLRIINESDDTLWISDITTAVMGAPSQRLNPWTTFEYSMPCSSQAISIIGTVGQVWIAQEY